MAKCNDIGKTLPLLDNIEDMMLFSDETGYMTIVYLGATSNQNPNNRDHYIWTDQSCFQFLVNIITLYAPSADIYRAGAEHVKRITLTHVDGCGKCVAVIYFPAVMSWRIVSVPCDVQLNVSLYCSAVMTHSTPVYNTTLSTIRIGFAENNFRRIEKGRYYSHEYYDDYGEQQPLWWFQQHEICLRIEHCVDSMNALNESCKPHKIYLFPYNDAHSSILHNGSLAAKFLSLFRATRTRKETRLDREGLPIGEGHLPILYSNASTINQSFSILTGSFLRMFAHDTNGFWGHREIEKVQTHNGRSLRSLSVLCTKDSLPPDQPTCSSTYFQCSDGTCLDEHLVCDGRQHCMMGEDEKNCTNICTDNVNCAFSCSYLTNCHCVRGFFQCQTGGCIAVGKLCDTVYNCEDGSDEPMSCKFDSAQIQRNAIEDQWKVLRQRCSHGSESKVLLVNPFDLNPPKVTNYSTDGDATLCTDIGVRYLICFDQDPNVGLSEEAPRYFLDRWCIYSYSWFADMGYAHFPCANGYHLSSCENMHCVDSFKCIGA